MVKFVAFTACLVAAIDAAEKAAGYAPQSLISPGHLWVWWVVAGGWCFNAWLVLRARIAD